MPDEPTMSPEAAARALADLPRYEEALTAKAFGITMMAFGIASAAIGMTYHLSTPWIIGNDVPWLFSFLWVPWIAAAATLTATVWHAQSISLVSYADDARKGSMWYVVLFSAFYLALLALASLVRAQTAWAAADGVLGLYVLSVFTAGLGAFFSWRHKAATLVRPMFVASALILAAAVVGDRGGFGGAGATLYGAAVTLVGYVGTGVAIARRG